MDQPLIFSLAALPDPSSLVPGWQAQEDQPMSSSTLDARRSTRKPQRSTRKAHRQLAAYNVPGSAFRWVGRDGWPLDM